MDTRLRHPARIAARTLRALRSSAAVAALVIAWGRSDDGGAAQQAALAAQGKQAFRFKTFGDELTTEKLHDRLERMLREMEREAEPG